MIVRLCVVLCLSALVGSNAEVTVKNSAYHDLLIKFSPNVPAENGKLIVDSLKELLLDTSNVLQTAIGLKIASVTFRLPATWDTSSWENEKVTSTPTHLGGVEDILVDATADSAFGKRPLALQYGGCGVPGHKITIPAVFLDSAQEYSKGKLLAREWLKYRYGVFDENGFDGDDLYPSYFQIPGTTDVKLTECTHPEAEHHFKDTNGNNCSLEIPFASEDCQVHYEQDSALNVTSSLMYFHQELQNMEHVCGKDHPHKSFTPSKHNILCDGQSIWDILEKSPDFKKSTEEEPGDDNGIIFSYLQEAKPRVVIAFENSGNLYDERYMVPLAIQRLIYGLPIDSEFGLYSFDDQPTAVRELAELKSDNDRRVTISASFLSEKVCVTCAVSKAVDVLLADNPQMYGSILLIVGTNLTEADTELIEKLKTSNLCLKVIAFTKDGNSVVGFQDLLSSSCSSITELSGYEVKSVLYKKLYQAMQSAVSQSPTEIETTTVEAGYMSSSSTLEIIMNANADKFYLWTASLVEAKYIICKDGDNNVLLNPTSVQTTTIASYTFDAAGIKEITVKCSLTHEKLNNVFTQVEMVKKPGKYFDEEVWIHDPTPETASEQMPVTIYVKINFDHYPIRDASVKALVLGPNQKIMEKALILFDNGRGDPDVTQYDGIYSRYFVEFVGEGEYRVIVSVNDDVQATIGKNGTDRCCGSKVKSTAESAGFFTRSLKTTFTAKGKKPEGGYKPSRIRDLRVDRYDPLNSIILKWTAPGGEVDKGHASSYEFLLFCKSEDCDENGQLPRWIKFNSSRPTPNTSGEDEVALFQLSNDVPNNLTVFFGLKSVNHNNQSSDISNLAQVRLEESSQPPTTEDPVEIQDRDTNPSLVGVTIGGAIIILMTIIIVAGLTYSCGRKRRAQKERSNKAISDSRGINGDIEISRSFKASNVDDMDSAMRRVESFPVLLYTHDQIRDCKIKRKEKDPPLYKSDVRRKPWMSLDALPSGRNSKKEEEDSADSASTLPANDNRSGLNEMKQLDGVSHSSELQLEKVAKF